ncbi:lipoyl synthase [candidate division WOR-1 bacterium RIFCSPHIGHO2_01_FULL_53_15]|uniref:Lipoyl synthase n=1 Tax=candidate division WOR-1 bacterium RIFCSPHIGHO2_01_FULL_53_15 TaxID=1802564 RepID=A0A1F4Q193_UNCSA|nr:MAG: lipoyl synthase [candidate division WOR-1 bacterium RIFCSPHIGHO2_01_FULL_53_15]OGC13883.1 MAG: lipoyl synthase [candidate division WOR-1 bacterium RIFCSPHIGHO2_02_FULL_53_26]
MSLPPFLVKKIPKQENINKIRALIGDPSLHTVCEEASCPNIGECYSQGTCTFIILGGVCSRSCAFCGVTRGTPLPPDPTEPGRIAEAVKKLGLNYVVITSVTRDDLPDGGAGHFAKVIDELRISNIEYRIEVLIPDFKGEISALKTVLDAKPNVLNHNIETVPRLYSKVRPQASYERSLNTIKRAKAQGGRIYTKSGFMVGLGETKEEAVYVLYDLKKADCDIVTIGQYLPPSRAHLKPPRFVDPAEFEEYQKLGEEMGLRVFAGPFVRSSYHAAKLEGILN